MNTPDLTQRPPRSPRVRLGGFVILPRMFDKGRATIAGRNGEYHFACPLDQHFLSFTGLKPDDVKEQLASGKNDFQMLEWIEQNAPCKHTPWEIQAWSAYHEQRVPGDVEARAFFNDAHKQAADYRTDIVTWFDLLDLDDYVTFLKK